MGSMRTLAIDCGGTGIKGSVLDEDGRMIANRLRVKTPYPLPPNRFVGVLAELARRLPPADRVTVGMPGMIRHGTVVATPHYITKRGPHSSVEPELERAWRGFDARYALESTMQLPTLVLNDAEVAGAGAVSGYGFEVMLTLGTGLGNAVFDNGVLLPHLEISRSPVRRGRLYDVESDPTELVDLYRDPELAEAKTQLLEELLKWTIRTEDDLPHGVYVQKRAERNWYAAHDFRP